MNIAKALRTPGFALLTLGAASMPAIVSAQPYTGGINVQGTKGALCSITVHDDAVNLNLDTSMICPLQSGPSDILDWTLKERENGQEARA